MSTSEKTSLYVGTALIALSVLIFRRRKDLVARDEVRRAANRANNAPVEVLADTLKQAWAPYHSA